MCECGAQDTIRWVAFDDLVVDSVTVLLSSDGGATFPHVLAHGEPNDSVFVWEVGEPLSASCRIKVVAYDNSGNTSEDASDGDFTVFDVAGVEAGLPASLDVVSVRPNPTSSGTHIVFSAASRGATVKIYDVTGRLVRQMSPSKAGTATDTFDTFWDGRSSDGIAMAPGIYFARIHAGDRVKTARIAITH